MLNFKSKKIHFLLALSFLLGLLVCFTGAQAIIIVVGVVLLLITLLNPKFGIFVLLFLQLGLTQSTEGLTKAKIVFIIFFFAVFVGWLLKKLIKGKISIPRSFLGLPIMIFGGMCFFSYIMAVYNNISTNVWFSCIHPFLNLVLFFVILDEFKSKKEIKLLIYEFLLVAALICLKDILFAVKMGGFNVVGEVAGTDYASLYFIFSIPLSIAIFLSAKNFWIKWLQIPLLLLYFFRILISLMRSYIIVFVAGEVMFILLLLSLRILKRKKLLFRIVTLTIIVFIIFGFLYLLFYQNANEYIQKNIFRFSVLKDFYSLKNGSMLDRIAEARAVWDQSWRQPIFGHGFGFKYQYYGSGHQLYEYNYVHDAPLYFFLTIGLAGLLIVIWLVRRTLSFNWRTLKNEKDLNWKIIEVALFVNFVIILILSLFITSAVRQDTVFYFVLAAGIIAALRNLQNKSMATPNDI